MCPPLAALSGFYSLNVKIINQLFSTEIEGWNGASHRIKIKTEAKANEVVADWGTGLNAALGILV